MESFADESSATMGAEALAAGGSQPKLGRLRTASEQRLYLAYRTLKYMARSHGSDIRKGIHLGLPAWKMIAKELNALSGVEKSADMWRKTYTSAKYFVHLKFFRYLKTKKIDRRNINWQLFSIKDLLYLQDLRSEGFADMPDVFLLLKACEEKKDFLNGRPSSSRPCVENAASSDSMHFSDSDDRSMDASKLSRAMEEQQPAAADEHAARYVDPLCLFDQNDTAPDIKVETSQYAMQNPEMSRPYQPYNDMAYAASTDAQQSDMMVSMPPNFPIITTPATAATNANDFAPYGSIGGGGSHQAASHPPLTQHSATESAMAMHQQQQSSQHFPHHPAANQHEQTHPSMSYDKMYPSVSMRPPPNLDPMWDFEQRILEMNEKMLREKMKHNKLLRKQNRLLEKSRKEQRKHTETLTKLLEQLVQRSH